MCDVDSDSGNEENVESMGKMKQRHKAEKIALKKKSAQLLHSFKKNDKKAKKQVQDDIKRLESELKARHTQELEEKNVEIEAKDSQDQELVANVEINNNAPSKISRKQRRLNARAAAEQARRAEVEEEIKNLPDEREIETQAIAEQLLPLNMTIREIRSDGNCLYSAIGDQLVASGEIIESPHHVFLRHRCAEYMRAHPDSLMPFLISDDGEMLTAAQFSEYCNDIVDPTHCVWGGQPEISALAASFRKRIIVYSGSAKPLEMGIDTCADPTHQPLRISFHRHYFGLGNHYNSVRNAQ